MNQRLILTGRDASGSEFKTFDTDRTLELYIDGANGLMISGNTAKVNLFTRVFPEVDEGVARQVTADRIEHTVEHREVVCRVVMGMETLFALTKFFNEVGEKLRSDLKIVPHEIKPGS